MCDVRAHQMPTNKETSELTIFLYQFIRLIIFGQEKRFIAEE